MPFHPDFSTMTLDDLQERLLNEDLIPSQLILRADIKKKLSTLKKNDFKSIADLETGLSTAKKIEVVSATTGIDQEYLKILGRAVRGYRVKPAVLADFPGIQASVIKKMNSLGLKTSQDFYEAAETPKLFKTLVSSSGLQNEVLVELFALCGLNRIQWVSPIFARLLFNSGFKNPKSIAKAQSKDLCEKVDATNKDKKLFKGKIGERDMGRIIALSKLMS